MPTTSESKTSSLPKPFVVLWLITLVTISIYIRLHGADDYHYNNDESMHYNIASANTLQEVLHRSLYETHPPLFYVLLHYWMVISADPAFVRGFSLFFGILTILLYYRIGNFLNNEFTGMYAAALVAFSPGWIAQSYVVRHYALLLFFLTCALYFYLLWKKNKKFLFLAAYTGCACAACLTHLSGILAIFCVAAYETLSLFLAKPERKNLLLWMGVNLVPAAITLIGYYFCEPAISDFKFHIQSDVSFHLDFSYYLLSALKYVPCVLFYFYPNPLIALFIVILTCMFLRHTPALRPWFTLSCLAILVGAILCCTGIYGMDSAKRHYIWTFPFLTIVSALLLSKLLSHNKITSLHKWALPITAGLLIICGCLAYDPVARFADTIEYQVPEKQWQSLSRFFDTLGPSDLIVATRDDAILLQDIYPYLQPPKTAALVPFRNTHILFSPLHRKLSKKEYMVSMLNDATNEHLLEGIHRIIFYQTQWELGNDADMTLCPLPNKQTITFAQTNPLSIYNPRVTGPYYAKLLITSKEEFYQQLFPPSSAPSDCMRQE